MALVVEDGTGKADAESYISVADADARRAKIDESATWTAATTTEKENALRVATEYLEGAYRLRWKGTKLLSTQALSWPRYWAFVDGYVLDSDEVPSAIANACADLALKALTDTLAADLTRGIVREKVGPLEVEYDRNTPQATRYRAVDMALAPFLRGASAMASLVRA